MSYVIHHHKRFPSAVESWILHDYDYHSRDLHDMKFVRLDQLIFIDRETGEKIRLVASVCLFVCLFVCLSVCLSELSCLNHLTYDLNFWHEGGPVDDLCICVSVISCCFDKLHVSGWSPFWLSIWVRLTQQITSHTFPHIITNNVRFYYLWVRCLHHSGYVN